MSGALPLQAPHSTFAALPTAGVCLKPYVKTHGPDGQLLTLSHQQLSALRTVLTGTRFRTRGCWQTRRQMDIPEVSLLIFGDAT